MKKILILLISIGWLSSCKKEGEIISQSKETLNTSSVIGRWCLTEVLVYPDVSFQKVSSSKIIEFHDDGIVSSNGDICVHSIEANAPSSGTYSILDSTLFSPECTQWPDDIKFSLENDSTLIIDYPYSWEAVRAKYMRIQ